MAKRLFAVALATGVMSTGLLAAGATDASAIATKTYTKPYSKSANFYSKPLGRCVKTTLSGKVTFKHYYYKQKGAISDAFLGVKLVNPTMHTTVLTKCTGGKKATVTKMSMTQRWYESTKCKLNVAIAAGYQWTVAVTPTVECGKRKAGTRATTYATKANNYTQSNSGRPVGFNGEVHIKYNTALCLSARTTVTAYINNKSDSWTNTIKACVKV
jgi:hypothetical protein